MEASAAGAKGTREADGDDNEPNGGGHDERQQATVLVPGSLFILCPLSSDGLWRGTHAKRKDVPASSCALDAS